MQKGIQPLSSARSGVRGRVVDCCVLSCHTGSSWSIPSRVQRSWKLVMNLRHLQVSSCSYRRCSTTSHPRFPHHFHLRQGCTSILMSPRIIVITVGRSDESRWPISDPVCFMVSTIKSLSFHSALLTSTSDTSEVCAHRLSLFSGISEALHCWSRFASTQQEGEIGQEGLHAHCHEACFPHGRAGDEPHTCSGWQAEHIAQPAERHAFQMRGKGCDLCQRSILIPCARQPVRCQCCW